MLNYTCFSPYVIIPRLNVKICSSQHLFQQKSWLISFRQGFVYYAVKIVKYEITVHYLNCCWSLKLACYRCSQFCQMGFFLAMPKTLLFSSPIKRGLNWCGRRSQCYFFWVLENTDIVIELHFYLFVLIFDAAFKFPADQLKRHKKVITGWINLQLAKVRIRLISRKYPL